MKILFIVFTLFLLATKVMAANVALVIENLPSTDSMTLTNANDTNDQIIEVLDKYKIPAMGFVNEERIYTDSNIQNRTDILKKWLSHGYELGNQSYSNKSYHMISDKEYFDGIIKGAKVLRKIMSEYNMKPRYFMPPFLHLGTNQRSYNDLVQFLKREHYILVPVTILNDDWVFNRAYNKALEEQDNKTAKNILAQYLEFTKKRFKFYTEASIHIFGREVDQIFLIHLNKINADCLSELIRIPIELGYKYENLETVLKDVPYNEKYRAFGRSGYSWLRRCDEMEGRLVDWRHEPQVDGF